MGNFDWGINKKDTRPLNIVLFTSRNKDNKDVEGFKERRKAFLTHEPIYSEKLKAEFKGFVEAGVRGEMSRFYYSINSRDSKKVYKEFLHFLIDNPDFNLCAAPAKLAGLAAKKENAKTKHWMFDFDNSNMEELFEFYHLVTNYMGDTNSIKYRMTPNGFAVIVDHGFDSRPCLEGKWANIVSLKRDDYLCYDWSIKN